jgi:deoxyribodipyrimidine photo-lyase
MVEDTRRAIAWFRRDLRLADNRTLEAATATAERVWPVFVADPELLDLHTDAPGRVAWFGANLHALDDRLRDHGSGLTVLHGRPEQVIPAFAATVGAEVVVAGADEDPIAAARDARVAIAMPLILVDDQRIVPPGQLLSRGGQPYAVYTPFRRALDVRVDEDPALTKPAEPDLRRLAPPPTGSAGHATFPRRDVPHPLPAAGEAAATDRLGDFLRRHLDDYREERDRPDADATSRLSPHLRVGAIGVRSLWRAATDAGVHGREARNARLVRAAATWRSELAWREFFAHLLAAHPRLATESLRPAFDALDWASGDEADEAIGAWRTGLTGFPLVDAGMRQLVAEGWMHNRARLVTASFLVKHLGVDWRRGESVFSEHLLDADMAQNNGNWQWVAGVGTDAAPYFRILNPTLQARRFDPHGTYIRRWVPELADVPTEAIHEPWRAGAPPGRYPAPMVDHADARQRALARYRAVG